MILISRGQGSTVRKFEKRIDDSLEDSLPKGRSASNGLELWRTSRNLHIEGLQGSEYLISSRAVAIGSLQAVWTRSL